MTALLEEDAARLLHAQLLDGGLRHFKRLRARQRFFQVWRPRNKAVDIREDWLRHLANWAFGLWVLSAAAGMLALPDLGTLARSWPGLLALAVLGSVPLGWTAYYGAGRTRGWAIGGLVLLGAAVLAGLTPWEMGPAVSAAGVAATWIGLREIRRRRPLVKTVNRPDGEPRQLLRIDSWQAVIWDAGTDHHAIRERVLSRFADCPMTQLRHRIERIWYRGVDGVEEREQIAVYFGRGILFCHVYPYGKDLYVGWDAHVNKGRWEERLIARGIDRPSGQLAQFHTIAPGTQDPTEYDVIDVSCLIEWAHAQIVQVLKQFMAERKIDQEIDFTILRGERQQLTGSREGDRERKSGLISRFRRKA